MKIHFCCTTHKLVHSAQNQSCPRLVGLRWSSRENTNSSHWLIGHFVSIYKSAHKIIAIHNWMHFSQLNRYRQYTVICVCSFVSLQAKLFRLWLRRLVKPYCMCLVVLEADIYIRTWLFFSDFVSICLHVCIFIFMR